MQPGMNAIVLPEPSGIWADADDSVDPVAAVELSFMAGADEADCSAAGADVAAALLVAAALVAAVLVAAVLVAASPDDEHAANNSMVAADMATAARPSVKRDMNTPFVVRQRYLRMPRWAVHGSKSHTLRCADNSRIAGKISCLTGVVNKNWPGWFTCRRTSRFEQTGSVELVKSDGNDQNGSDGHGLPKWLNLDQDQTVVQDSRDHHPHSCAEDCAASTE